MTNKSVRVVTANQRVIIETTPKGRTTVSTLDNKGRIKTTTIPGLGPTEYFYYDDGINKGKLYQIKQGNDRIYIFEYDSNGHLHKVTDPVGNVVTYINDAVGRVTKQILPEDPLRPGADRELDLTYDGNGNIETIEPPPINPPTSPVHTFDYTPINQEQTYNPPDVFAGVDFTSYTYNYDHQLDYVDRPYLNGETQEQIDFHYDQTTARLDWMNIPGRGTVNFGYNSATEQLTSITTPEGNSLTYTYDGALLTETTWSGAVQGNVQRSYNNDFKIETLSVNDDDDTMATMVYDDDGLLTTIKIDDPPVDLLTLFPVIRTV